MKNVISCVTQIVGDVQLYLVEEPRLAGGADSVLNCVVTLCSAVKSAAESIGGSLFVPGYGPICIAKDEEVIVKAMGLAPALRAQWKSPEIAFADLRWLAEQGMIRRN